MKFVDDLFGGNLPLVLAPVEESYSMLRPITPEELGLSFAREGGFDLVVSDSRKFAKVFHKQHKNVIRDIDGIRQKIGSELSRSFFRQGNYFDDYGRQQSCFDITKRGALVLGAQYDPMVAVAVVTAFEAMANALGERATEHVQPVYDVIETALQQWHARTEHTVIKTVKQTMAPVIEVLEWIQAALNRRRVEVSAKDQKIHCNVVLTFFAGRCPCCQRQSIVDPEGNILRQANGVLPVAQYDHTTQSQSADLYHIWLICADGPQSCHYKLTHGSAAVQLRLDVVHAHRNYVARVIEYLQLIDKQEKLPL